MVCHDTASYMRQVIFIHVNGTARQADIKLMTESRCNPLLVPGQYRGPFHHQMKSLFRREWHRCGAPDTPQAGSVNGLALGTPTHTIGLAYISNIFSFVKLLACTCNALGCTKNAGKIKSAFSHQWNTSIIFHIIPCILVRSQTLILTWGHLVQCFEGVAVTIISSEIAISLLRNHFWFQGISKSFISWNLKSTYTNLYHHICTLGKIKFAQTVCLEAMLLLQAEVLVHWLSDTIAKACGT